MAIDFIYPDMFFEWEYTFIPSDYWTNKDKRILAMKQLIECRLKIDVNDVPKVLSYMYFHLSSKYHKFQYIINVHYNLNVYQYLNECFRISAADAEIKIATGESYLVDKFFYEQSEEVEPVTEVKEVVSNVVNFADKLKAKKDNEDLEKAKSHFMNNILPSMTMEEKQKVLFFNPDMMQEILLDVMLRIQIKNM
jgi:hypothetical protein